MGLKLLFCGLANAGKTSILRVLDDRALDIPGLLPTPGVQYDSFKVLGFDISTWDLGGQVNLRKRYLIEYDRYFQATSAIFFVIDVQYVTDFKENLEYLNGILDVLKKLELTNVFIALLLHKYDPHLQVKDERIQKKIEPIAEKVEKAIASFPHAFYRTSIYDPPSIFKAFSDTLLRCMPQSEVLRLKIEEIAKKVSSPAVGLLAGNGKLYGNWHSPEISIPDLAKFDQKLPVFAKLYSQDLFKNMSVFPMGEHANIIVLTFLFREQLVLFLAMINKGANIEEAQHILQKEQESLIKTLEILQFD